MKKAQTTTQKILAFIGFFVLLSVLGVTVYFLDGSQSDSSKPSSLSFIFRNDVWADYKFPGCSKPNLLNKEKTSGGISQVDQYLKYPNNKFGLYAYPDEQLLVKAEEMVNGRGGDWGYVLIPFNVQELDDTKWFKLFWGLSELHLTPVVQLWNIDQKGDIDKQINESADFLNSLPWPTEKRFVSVYNETNDARFWGGKVEPNQYAEVLSKTADKLHKLDKRFFVMNGAFNASARNGKGYMDEEKYLYEMNQAEPGVFKKLDGWASHPYPQPNFSGSPDDKGRDSIRAYEWELLILKHFFEVENLPVFITETGWAHAEGKDYDDSYPSEKQAAKNYVEAFEKVWLDDPRVVAVMPFTIIYDEPFDHFSFIHKDDKGVYEPFNSLRDYPKTAGLPDLSAEHFNRINEVGPCSPGK